MCYLEWFGRLKVLFLLFIYLKIHPKVVVKYNRTLNPLQGIYTQKRAPQN